MKLFFVMFPLFVMLLTVDFTVASSYDAFYGGDSTSIITPNCKEYAIPGCPRDLNPVCGTDSLTYANECILCEKNREKGQDVQIKWRGPC
ncbi:serine protease inhibitor Kazal-type 2 [Trichosurus vulpecula]|uniref:serine protease inhibitor Kazal-type 2 n=1 Tax=Trichosurus vulpecula TaxID=9337 RepID=UPI00186B1AE1|nr:serine protease inhibitor Kazal-type 2 [Trichosurus vulpecula]